MNLYLHFSYCWADMGNVNPAKKCRLVTRLVEHVQSESRALLKLCHVVFCGTHGSTGKHLLNFVFRGTRCSARKTCSMCCVGQETSVPYCVPWNMVVYRKTSAQ